MSCPGTTPQALETWAKAGFPLSDKQGQKTVLTTCLTTSGTKLNNQKSGISAVGSALALGVPWLYPGRDEVKRRDPLRHLRLRDLFRFAKPAQKWL